MYVLILTWILNGKLYYHEFTYTKVECIKQLSYAKNDLHALNAKVLVAKCNPVEK